MLTTKLFEEDRVLKTMFEIRQYRVALMSKSAVYRLKGWVGGLILFLRPDFLSPPTQPFCCDRVLSKPSAAGQTPSPGELRPQSSFAENEDSFCASALLLCHRTDLDFFLVWRKNVFEVCKFPASLVFVK